MTAYTFAMQYNDGERDYDFLNAYIEELRAELAEARAASEGAERMLCAVIDAHYGSSYHHIGDGDGVTADEAKAIRTYLAAREEATR